MSFVPIAPVSGAGDVSSVMFISMKITFFLAPGPYIAHFIPNAALTQFNQCRKLNKIYSAFTRCPLLSI